MSNVFNLPTVEDCTLVIQPQNVPVDVMEVYDMYTDSRKEAEKLGRVDPSGKGRPHIPVFVEAFEAKYGIPLSFAAAVLLINKVSLATVELKKKCEGLLRFSDSTLDSPTSSTQTMEPTSDS